MTSGTCRALIATAALAIAASAAMPAGAAPARIDACLVGTWRTTSVDSLGTIPDPQRGAGVVLQIGADGREIVTYDGMVPLKKPVKPTPSGGWIYGYDSFGGSATALFATPTPGRAALAGMLGSSVTTTYDDASGTHSHPLGKTLGPGGLGNDPHGSYRCSKTSLEVSNAGFTFKYEPFAGTGGRAVGGKGPANAAGGPNFKPFPSGQFCAKNDGAVADTYPCTGPVKPSGFVFTARLKKPIPAPFDTVKFYTVPVTSTSGVIGGVTGSGTTINSEYTITAPVQLCMNTGTKYAVRVFIGGVSYGDIGVFWPDCR
jgi:hypothetical protein